MRRWIACLAVVLLCMQTAVADEGMWLINRLGEIYPQMKSKGLKIKDKEIYNEQTSALADAVVAVDGGMGTGSMISDEGLMITNHHVAFSDICALSTPEHNYLETGFWARTRGDEIPVAGKTVWFLRKVVDVTEEVEAIRSGMMAEGKWGIMGMRRVYKEIEDRYAAQTEHEVSCYSMWGGKMYLMFYYDVYKDVRLVGTPPVTLGAFGGDHDNWGWPQHKGDFTLYRVYADAEGRPAEYSAGNVPYTPRMTPSSATRYPGSVMSSCPGAGAETMVPLMIVSAMLPSPFFAEFRTKEKECPTDSAPAPIGQTPIAEPFGGSVETFAPLPANLYERSCFFFVSSP